MKGKRTCLTLMGLAAGTVGSYLAYQAYLKAKESCPPFRKRVYTDAQQLIGAFHQLWCHPEDLIALRRSRLVVRPLPEKIMLAVAGTNGSRHPSLAHARYAVRRGVPPEAVNSLLRGQVEHAKVEEGPALLFALHYAENRGQPEPGTIERLAEAYGPDEAWNILTYLRLVTLADLVGNTLDALISRALGHPSSETSLYDELSVLGIFLFGMVPMVPLLILRSMSAPSGAG